MKAADAGRASLLVDSLKDLKTLEDYLDDDENLEDIDIRPASGGDEGVIIDGMTFRPLIPLIRRIVLEELEVMGVEDAG